MNDQGAKIVNYMREYLHSFRLAKGRSPETIYLTSAQADTLKSAIKSAIYKRKFIPADLDRDGSSFDGVQIKVYNGQNS